MTFLKTLRDADVTLAAAASPLVAGLFGLVLWGIPLTLYVVAAATESNATLQTMWYVVVALHVGVGLLVDVEALTTRGTFWPLQTVIVCGATFITFTLPAFLGYYLVQDPDGRHVVLTSCALGFACLANAVMVSILFEYFHRSVAQRGAPPQTTVPRRRASAGV